MSKQQEKAELDRLLRSPHFQGARLREVLIYLCRRRWEDQEAEVRQYDLAEALYGDVDEVVSARNLVKRLRQQLALDYADHKNGSELRLEIPLGSYQVVFRPTGNETTEPQTTGGDPDDATSGEVVNGNARGLLRIAAWVSGAVILAVLLIAGGGSLWLDTDGMAADESAEDKLAELSSHRGIAAYVRPEEGELIGYTEDGNFAWSRPYPSPFQSFQAYEAVTGRRWFYVVFGGKANNSRKVPGTDPPQIEVLSNRGERQEYINLLEVFNPYGETHHPDYFHLRVLNLGNQNPGDNQALTDLNADGYQDLLIRCKHNYYPNILYFISGKSHECTGAFANSGKIRDVKCVHIDQVGAGAIVIGLAVNNPMGELESIFTMSLETLQASPDLPLGWTKLSKNYRPLGVIPNMTILDPDPNDSKMGIVRIHGPGIDWQFNAGNGTLRKPDEPWFENGFFEDQVASRQLKNDRMKLYTGMWEAKNNILHGNDGYDIERGIEFYRQKLEQLSDAPSGFWSDPPMAFYVGYDAVSALMEAGEIERALNFLQDYFPSPDESVHPRKTWILRGKLLTLQGLDYEGAMRAFTATDRSDYCAAGYVQACALTGCGREALDEALIDEFATVYRCPAVAAWLMIPDMLNGDLFNLAFSYESAVGERREVENENIFLSDMHYPQEYEFWTALAGLMMSRVRAQHENGWPDKDKRPAESDPVLPAKIEFLDAYASYLEDSSTDALKNLEKAFRDLERLSHSRVTALVPYVLAAYFCGFAADEAGEQDLAAEALCLALARYDKGEHARQAREILARYGITQDQCPGESTSME